MNFFVILDEDFENGALMQDLLSETKKEFWNENQGQGST